MSPIFVSSFSGILSIPELILGLSFLIRLQISMGAVYTNSKEEAHGLVR